MPSLKRKIPSIASLRPDVQAAEHYTNLSFAFAISLGVVKRMTWEQTPWLLPKISVPESTRISTYYEVCFDKTIAPEAIQNALLLGSTFTTQEQKDEFGRGTQVYVVFPNLKRDIRKNKKFLTTWHNEVVLPAFNRAWEDSGLTPVFERGMCKDTLSIFHYKMARRADHILEHLDLHGKKKGSTLLREHWPDYDEKYQIDGVKEHNINDRWGIFDEAWKSITGMLEGVLPKFEKPVLLLMNKARTDLNPDHGVSKIYEIVGQQWDKNIDSRFIVPGSFRVVLQTVVGGAIPCELSDEEDEEPRVGHRLIKEGPVEKDAVEVDFKRMGDEEPAMERPTKRPCIGSFAYYDQ
ncbi:hypothetical protein BDV96DRAFT_496538 [Lophiotrema nucula]|uniref:Uncharacterized protein n=1 Tax=Lophiotrema nucula TaxID=690887 RepID=A0A6A5Z1W1_9PLEO|nr:hypothetical protein BDV96DRAFT_496538 [Lophiotrema nucula]